MYNLYSILKDIDDLPNGETKRINCPECGGYKTFTVTNNMGRMIWNCYKASCSISGSKPVHMSANDIRQAIERKEKAREHFVMPEYVVPYRGQPDITRFMEKFDLMGGLYHDVKDNRAVFPIMQDGVVVDAVGRSLRNSLPKWKKYGNSGLPYTSGCGRIAVVVEDCVSAVIVGSDVYVGVAVLGTSLSDIHKRYLSQFSSAVVALDPDALPKAMEFFKDLKSTVNDVRVLRLTDDLKYKHPNDIEKLTAIGEQINGNSINS
mgnify:FL=1|tara:strand:- start:4702 stop:5487 length:786 start_codon:yes stop_codon:yes gene_type:complete